MRIAPAVSQPTWQLLQLLGRPVLRGDQPERAVALAAQLPPEQWRLLARRATEQRVAFWLLGHARTLGLPVPAPARLQLDTAATEALARTLDADRVLTRIAPRLLDGPTPPCLLLKGRGVESRAYPEGVLRPVVDVDVLVHPAARAEASAHLRELGFDEIWRSRSRHIGQWLERGGTGTVEVHERPLCPMRFAPMREPALVEAWFAASIAGAGPFRQPGDADHTAFLLVHLLEGIYADLRHRADLGQWLRVVRPDAAAVRARLQAWQAVRAGATALRVVAADDPDAVAADLRAIAALAAESPGPWPLAAAALRKWAGVRPRWYGGATPRWLEGGGLAAHLDRPGRWFVSWTPAGRWLGMPRPTDAQE